MNTHREIGMAGCLGAVAGLAVAIICDWNSFLLLPSALVGALTALVRYHPYEVASTIGAFSRDVGGAFKKVVSFDRREVWKIARRTAFVVVCVFLGGGSAILIPVLAAKAGIVIQPKADTVPVAAAIALEVIVALVVGFGGFLFFTVGLGEIRTQWPMPLTRKVRSIVGHWLASIEQPMDRWFGREKPTKRGILTVCLVGPIVVQVVGCLMAVALVLDAIVTIILACASSERIAAILGATLGFCVGTVLHFAGVTDTLAGSLFILAAGGTVGRFAGPLLYRLREYLAREPAVETVQS